MPDYLPQEKIQPVSRSTVFKTLFPVCLIFLSVNFFSYFYLQKHNPNLGYVIASRKWKMLEDMKEKKDWLILGDSTCNQGISVSLFERETGESAVNLCTIGNMLAVGDSWMLDIYIKKFGPPKNVLIVHTYDVWYRDNLNLSLISQLPIGFLEKEKPDPWLLSLKDEMTLYAYKYFPVYSQNESISELVSGLAKKTEANNWSFDENGYMSVNFSDPSALAEETEGLKKILKSNKFQMSKNNGIALENIKKLAERYGFNVYLANSPVYEVLAGDENYKSFFGDVSEALKKFDGGSDNVVYLENAHPFAADKMSSADHVNSAGAAEYTGQIIDELKGGRAFAK